MLSGTIGESAASSEDDGGDRMTGEERLQYTLKGVEKRSLELMRDAARADGMKIGAWVSKRMREAAESSLAASSGQKRIASRLSVAATGVAAPHEVDVKGIDLRIELLSEKLSATIELNFKLLHADIDKIREAQNILISGLIAGGVRVRDE